LAGTIFVPDTNVGAGPVVPTILKFILDMNYFIETTEALKRLRGEVSLEYVIVGAFIVTLVIAVFSDTGASTIARALTGGFATIVAAMNPP
jgi:hypothetical protein